MSVGEREHWRGGWVSVERPGYFGKKKDTLFEEWNIQYGEGNWRLANVTKEGEIYDYEDIIFRVMVPGYVRHFDTNPEEAEFILSNYSYGYDKHMISKAEAFDPYALYQKPGVPNQFHHVAFNRALSDYFGPFKGEGPLQIRQGKPGTDIGGWPAGWRWSPGFIKTVRADLIPEPRIEGWWELNDSIEAFYQNTKTFQVRN